MRTTAAGHVSKFLQDRINVFFTTTASQSEIYFTERAVVIYRSRATPLRDNSATIFWFTCLSFKRTRVIQLNKLRRPQTVLHWLTVDWQNVFQPYVCLHELCSYRFSRRTSRLWCPRHDYKHSDVTCNASSVSSLAREGTGSTRLEFTCQELCWRKIFESSLWVFLYKPSQNIYPMRRSFY